MLIKVGNGVNLADAGVLEVKLLNWTLGYVDTWWLFLLEFCGEEKNVFVIYIIMKCTEVVYLSFYEGVWFYLFWYFVTIILYCVFKWRLCEGCFYSAGFEKIEVFRKI